jgi:shikimate dehydrogenase
MRRAAVLGQPIGHSLSPVLHRAGYAGAGLADWSYDAFECGEADLAAFVAELGTEWAGLSLTMPLKEVALAVADVVAPIAADIGAANTLVRRPDGRWWATNTDAPGMVDALLATAEEPALDAKAWPANQAMATLEIPADGAGLATPPELAAAEGLIAAGFAVLGAGGTARAALAAASSLGAAEVTVFARRREAVERLEPAARALGLTIVFRDWADAGAGAGEYGVVITTVPKGVADPLAGEVLWREPGVLFDAVYDPWPTPIAAAAQRAGRRIVSGLDLLLAQAVRQFELFTGVPAPATVMDSALREAAARR